MNRYAMKAVVLLLALAAVAPARAAGPAVTIYTHDLGYVRETRALDLRAATDTVRIENVSSALDFSSVRLTPRDAGAKVTRLSYRYDVASSDALLDRARGSRVRIGSRGDRVTEGTLIAADGAWLTVRAADGSIQTVSREAVETVSLANPGSLALKPAIEAAIEGGRKGKLDCELAYLTGGLSWNAEHTVVRKGENEATWSTNVTVENNTGRDYVDAALKLVAGEPRRAPGAMAPMPRAEKMMVTMADAVQSMPEVAFADYHLYTLPGTATLRDRESQSVAMLSPRTVKLSPRYFYRGGDPRGVTTQLVTTNENANGLGVPLAGGRVRIYEPDPSGALQFTGETTIGHTAQGEKVTLDIGQAFDLVGERKELSNKRVSDREREIAVEITLRNRKPNAVTITVQESVGGDTEITQKSQAFTRKDANTIEFEVPVPAGKEVKVTYTAHTRY